MNYTQAGQSGVVGTKSVHPGPSEDLQGPKRGLSGTFANFGQTMTHFGILWQFLSTLALGGYFWLLLATFGNFWWLGDNLAPRTIWHLGQFGTEDNLAPGQFGTKSVKEDNLAPRTIWHQECKIGQFGTRTIWHRNEKRTIWHRNEKRTIWHQDNLAPQCKRDNLAPGCIRRRNAISRWERNTLSNGR